MENPIVEISDGSLRGITKEGFEGLFLILAFLGIPYAKPPLGNLRFKAPVPAEPWEGVRDAVEDGSACYQDFGGNGNLFGSEDCLFLNVFTKNVSGNQTLKPVLVYFHGGAFIIGSGASTDYNPTFLLKEDIVFVAVNYRLGVLGFLKLNDTSLDVPGNAGLKDQILALKWIQKNIQKFGGDPNQVTISGNSAGSASVNYHLLSPSSKGLFHRGIMQSGSVLNPWPYLNPTYLEIVKYLKEKCECRNDAEILEALSNASVVELVTAQSGWINSLEDATFHWFAPSVENPNPTAFLTRKPIDVISSGDYHKVPLIIGYNSNEGLYAILTDPDTEEQRYANGQFRPQQMVWPDNKKTKERLLRKLKELYGNEKYRNNLYLPSGDSMFSVGITAMAEQFAVSNPKNTYFYVFDLVASRNLFRRTWNVDDQLPGASHEDELGYLYDSEDLSDSPPERGTIEYTAVRRITQLWGNFVINGNPTPKRNNLNFTWKPFKRLTPYYLHFGEELSLKRNPAEDRIRIWRQVYNSNKTTQNYFP